ncbi:MAG: ATP-binding protein, partial [Verrucomicrobiia bacterium]
MRDLLRKALSASRESKHVEFKSVFHPDSAEHWCELVKDIAAISNSGGGIIVVGLDSRGLPVEESCPELRDLDPADVADKLTRYTGSHSVEIELTEATKKGKRVFCFLIEPARIPLVFTKPGTYDIGGGKQKSAFGLGTVYFRHGAKSDPGNSNDIRMAIERQLDCIRKEWVRGVRKVVAAPQGAQIITLSPRRLGDRSGGVSAVRIVSDPAAPAFRVTRNRSESHGMLVHEELSERVFDEINNIIDANAILAKGQKRFFLGVPVYYRIYAERENVSRTASNIELLTRAAVTDFYAPCLYWLNYLTDKQCATLLGELFRIPKSPHVHNLMRIAVLLGPEFSKWLFDKWSAKWGQYSQPPTFYWTYKKMWNRTNAGDRRLIALRLHNTSMFDLGDGKTSLPVRQLLEKPSQAAEAL